MAEVIEKRDDIDGTPADEEIVFGWNGKSHVLDLNHANAEVFREVITPWVDAARVVSPSRRRTREHRDRAAAIRLWAQQTGIPCGTRGRLPKNVIRQYENRLTT